MIQNLNCKGCYAGICLKGMRENLKNMTAELLADENCLDRQSTVEDVYNM
jgi:hypothetical protein